MPEIVITNKVIILPKGKRVLSQFVTGYDYVEGGRIHLHNGLSFTAWPPDKKDVFLAFMDMQMSNPKAAIVDLRDLYKSVFGVVEAVEETVTEEGTSAISPSSAKGTSA